MPIKIEFTLVAGRLVGRTESDRWNLATFGIVSIPYDGRNQAALKRFRRRFASSKYAADFTFSYKGSDHV